MEENKTNGRDEIYSAKVKAGKRTYFFDVKSTRSNDYYLTITESKKRLGKEGKVFYEKHKIFLYKEDFNKFIKALGEAVDYVKTELMPDFDFDAFNHDNVPSENGESEAPEATSMTNEKKVTEPTPTPSDNGTHEDVDKW